MYYLIGDYLIINPENIDLNSYGIYQKEVSDKFLDYIIFLEILVFISSIIAVCLTFNYQEEDSSKTEELDEKIQLKKLIQVLYMDAFSQKNLFLSLFSFCGTCFYFNENIQRYYS